MDALAFYHVQREDAPGFWQDLPGGSQFDQFWKATRAAQAYHEHSHQPARICNSRGAVVWDSARDLPHPQDEPALPYEE